MKHTYFDELRDPNTTLPNGSPLPDNLFDFSREEKNTDRDAMEVLIPQWYVQKMAAQGKKA